MPHTNPEETLPERAMPQLTDVEPCGTVAYLTYYVPEMFWSFYGADTPAYVEEIVREQGYDVIEVSSNYPPAVVVVKVERPEVG